MRFDDITSRIPPGTDVLFAEIRAHHAYASDEQPPHATVHAHGLLKPWTTAATWQKFNATTPWDTPGGDFGPILDSSSACCHGDISTWNITDLARQWRNAATTNHGVIFETPYRDPYQKPAYGAPSLFVVYGRDVDGPNVALSGSLTNRFGRATRGGSHQLTIAATDKRAGLMGTGVARVSIEVNGVTEYEREAPCANDACSDSWTFEAEQYDLGRMEFQILAEDAAGNRTSLVYATKNVAPRASGPATRSLLSDGTQVQVDGAAAGDQLGRSVSPIGDLNDDAIDDYIIGAPLADPAGRANAGSAYVIYGRTGSRVIDLSSWDPADGFRITGAAAGDRLGETVAGAGDVNGDGVEDLVLGAPAIANGATPTTRGRVYVVFGTDASAGAAVDVNLAQLGSRGFAITGPAPSATAADARPFGTAVAARSNVSVHVGASNDINDDGKDDIVVGSPGESRNGRARSGAAYVIFGKATTGTVDTALLGTGGFRLDGAVAGERLGASAAYLDEATGDNLADLALGAPGRNAPGRTNGGAVYLVPGKVSSTAVDLSTLGASGAIRIDGRTGRRLGSSVTAVGDVNYDGRADTALGGHGITVFHGAPPGGAVDEAAAGFPGLRGLAPVDTAYDELVVAGMDDIDGDLVNDLLVAAPNLPQAESWGIYGREAAEDINLATLQASQGFRVQAAAQPTPLAVSGANDATARGESDALMGLPLSNRNGRVDSGTVILHRGPARPDCYDDLSAVPNGSTWLCSELGGVSVSGEGGGAGATAEAASAARDLRLCRARTDFLCTMFEEGDYGIVHPETGRRIKYGRVRAEAKLILGVGPQRVWPGGVMGGHSSYAQALEQISGPAIKPTLIVRCRIDRSQFPDRDCQQPNEEREAAVFRYTRFRMPAVGHIQSIHEKGAKNFLEMIFQWEARGKPPLRDSDGLWEFNEPSDSIQTERFTCDDYDGGDPGDLQCTFDD